MLKDPYVAFMQTMFDKIFILSFGRELPAGSYPFMMQGAFPYLCSQIVILGKSPAYYAMNNAFGPIYIDESYQTSRVYTLCMASSRSV